MEKFRRRSSADSGISYLERALSGLTTQRTRHPSSPSIIEYSEPTESFKGPLGLNLLYEPSEPLVDFIFVHGLGGGSRKTWARTEHPYHYWPKEWLPRDPDFKHVRIHSFGYNATWGERKSSILEINDFARALLGEIKDNPEIRKHDTRLVLIGHSMGGLVIKKAYIVARQDPAFQDVATRIHTMYFLATPHRGSDLARVLVNILRVTWGQKPFVNDLEPNSGMISGINETFRHYAQDLQLWSFYETLQSNLVVYNALVVDKSSATLGYPHERTALLNADHRGVCKYERPSDPNYKTVRNAFSTTVEAITTEAFRIRREATRSDLQRLASLTGVLDLPEDDLLALEDARIPGSCEWLTSRTEFEEWRVSWSNASSILWLNGNPASGKSVLASHIIGHLEGHNLDCSYFFFKHGITTKSSVGDCLRSLAYQMALCSVEIRNRLLVLHDTGVSLEQSDERAIWRKLFLGGVFQATVVQPHYWVIDALDECSKPQSILSLINSIGQHIPLRICLTSRDLPEIRKPFDQLGSRAMSLRIQASDTVDDIKLFVADRIERIYVAAANERSTLIDKIMAKSNGSFLWVRLVMQELENVWTKEGIEEVLHEIPADMNMLYIRTLEKMSKVPRAAKLARAILTWTVCASRLLTITEMQAALRLDIKETVPNLDKAIPSICGQLVFVDQRLRIQMIHQTAISFLIQEDLDSEFAIRKTEAHARLANICLEFLSGGEFKGQRTLKTKQITANDNIEEHAFTDYACQYFSDHLYKSSSLQSEPWDSLQEFFEQNVLLWIEYLAKTGEIHVITRTASNIKAYLGRRAKYFPPIGQRVQSIKAWTVDLIRVCAKFRTSLLTSPASIHRLIPPMCPADSMLAKQFTSPYRGLRVVGTAAKSWDDCISQINYLGSQATAIACGDLYFAVGLSTGKIMLYHHTTSLIHCVLNHNERVKLVKFSGQSKILASSGPRILRLWNAITGHQVWSVSVFHQILGVVFINNDECLLAATQAEHIICWSLADGIELNRTGWHNSFIEDSNKQQKRQAPSHAVFSPDCHLLAISYRGRSVLLFDVDSDMLYGECVRRSTSSSNSSVMYYPVLSMLFNPNSGFAHLLVSYGDGELAIYDSRTLSLCHRLPNIHAQALACSADGRTLVTGGSFGTIEIYDLDRICGGGPNLIHRLKAKKEGVKGLAFSNDDRRFVDICGSQCRVWEPAILIRQDLEHGDQSEVSDSITLPPESVDIEDGAVNAEITAIACHQDGIIVFCGKQDGSVAVFETETGMERNILYRHASHVTVNHLFWGKREGILVSADESSRIIVRKVVSEKSIWFATEVLADRRFTGSVTGLLLNHNDDRLLVTGAGTDELWTIRGAKMGFKAYKTHEFRKTICHPNPEFLITFEATVARIQAWKDMEDQTDSEGAKLSRSCKTVFTGSAASMFCQDKENFVELLKPGWDTSSRVLECWQAGDFQAEAKTVIPLPGFEMLGPCIDLIIAIIGHRLLFLDTDLWICSLDLLSFPTTPTVKRHFFIPSDWQNTSGDMLLQLNPRNEFILAKKDELMIIKRGLDYSEVISLAKVQKWTFNHGTKLSSSPS